MLAAEMDGGADRQRLGQPAVVGVEAARLVADDQEAAQPAGHQHRLDEHVGELHPGREEPRHVGEPLPLLGVELLVGGERVDEGVAALLAGQQRLRPPVAEPGAGQLGHELAPVGGAQVVDAELGADLARGGRGEGAQVAEVDARVLGRGEEHPVLLLEQLVQRLDFADPCPHRLRHLFVADRAEHPAEAEEEQADRVDGEEAEGREMDLDRREGDRQQGQADGDLPLPVEEPRRPGGDAGEDGEERGLAFVPLDVEACPREDGQPGPREEDKRKAEPAAPHGGAHSTDGTSEFDIDGTELDRG